MNNHIVVASLAMLGLLTSNLALAEENSSAAMPNSLEAPAIVAANVAAPVTVEPEPQFGASDAADPSDLPAQPREAQSLAELVRQSDLDDTPDAEEKCLATAVYYEARSESLAGQLAVAHVVLQRAKSGRFPSSLCGVVTQPGQFSFVRAGRLPATPGNAAQWRTAQAIAQIAMAGSWENPVRGALYFHAARVSPGWDRARVMRIGGHVFYR